MVVVPLTHSRAALHWRSFEAWVGTRSSAVALFVLALSVYALQSLVLPAYPGRDMSRYLQAYVQYWYDEPVLPAVLSTRNPLSTLGIGVPLELGGAAAEVWLALLFAASVVAWAATGLVFGRRSALVVAAVVLFYPSYGILFHQLSSDALFAAAFAGWTFVLSRTIPRPSVSMFLALGAGVGLLTLVRPSNQVLLGFVLLPVLLRAPWRSRLTWVAAFFASAALVIQAWRLVVSLRYGDAAWLRPSAGVVILTVALLVLVLLPPRWHKRFVVIGLPVAFAVLVAAGVQGQGPTSASRSLVQGASLNVFFFRAFQMDRIVLPENGPASRRLARIVQRDLLTKEPYRSYGVDVDTVFSSGSDRIFGDLNGLTGVDFRAVTREAIQEHPRAFLQGISRTIWKLLSARVFAPEGLAVPGDEPPVSPKDGSRDVIVVNGRELPRPSEGQPIPASRFGPALWTLHGDAREVWRSATRHELVFDDPRDEARYRDFESETGRFADRLPTRDARGELVHRLNQASRAFPIPFLWLLAGAVGLAIRRPERALVAIAVTLAALAVIVGTGLVAMPVSEYAVPVGPAFMLLAVAGFLGRRSTRRA